MRKFLFFGLILLITLYAIQVAPEFAFTQSEDEPFELSSDYDTTRGGKEITISGTVYCQIEEGATVLFGDAGENPKTAEFVDYIPEEGDKEEQIKVKVPSWGEEAIVDVTVENPDGRQYTYEEAFEYLITPEIDNIYPNYWVSGEDNEITITGSNLNRADLYIGGHLIEDISDQGEGQIVFDGLPDEYSSGSYDVKVEDSSDSRAKHEISDGLFYKTKKSSPIIDEMVPNTGLVDKEMEIVITGEQLFTGSELFIGDNSIVDTVNDTVHMDFRSTTEVHVTLPVWDDTSAGSKDVRWVNEDGGEYNSPNGFTYLSEEIVHINDISPSSGYRDDYTRVTISGENFKENAEMDLEMVFPDGTERNFSDIEWVSEDTIVATTPQGIIEDGEEFAECDVKIMHDYDDVVQTDTLENGFTYYLPESKPVIYEIFDKEVWEDENQMENSGSISGGNEVVIIGEDFRDRSGLKIEFGEENEVSEEDIIEIETIKADDERYSDWEDKMKMVVIAPEGAETGRVDVTVTNPDGNSATKSDGWIYRTSNMYIYSVTPSEGTEGDLISLQGNNYEEDISLTIDLIHVSDDENYGVVTTVYEDDYEYDDDNIGLTLPESIPGSKEIRVSNRFGEARADFEYTYTVLAPQINDVAPSKVSAEGGTEITITGEDFIEKAEIDGEEEKIQVKIGDEFVEEDDVTIVSSKEVKVTTPKNNPGETEVTVINPGGNSDSAAIEYISSPEINTVTPDKLHINGGMIVTIEGNEFYEGAEVYFTDGDDEERAPDEKFVDNNTIYARVPAVDNTGDYDVVVRNNDYDENTEEDYGEAVLEDAVSFEEPPESLPKVTGVSPYRGPVAGGTEVVVSGENIDPDSEVYFGLEKAEVIDYLGEDAVKVKIPPNEAGEYKVTITNPNGGTGVSENDKGNQIPVFEYLEPATTPVIEEINPDIGQTDGGNHVTIRGKDFRPGAEVYFDGAAASDVEVTLEDSSEDLYKLSCKTPKGELGFADVVVINPADSFGITVEEDGFEYRNPDSAPEISGVTPDKGPTTGGTKVTIEGEDFRNNVKVYFDGITAGDITVVDEDTITAEAPAHWEASVPVTVVNYDGGSFTKIEAFEYREAGSSPEISSVDPEFGPALEQTWVTISGQDFRTNPEIYFGSKKAPEVNLLDYETIKALAPAQEEGTVDVSVVNEDFGTAVFENGFTYRGSSPEIDEVRPNSGDMSGGDTVNIIGTDFIVRYEDDNLSVAPAVYFVQDDIEVEAEALEGSTSERLKVVSPKAPGQRIGFSDIRIINNDGKEAVVKDGFKYTSADSAPEFRDIDPSKGTIEGGTPVEIFGEDFREDVLVFIGGKEAEEINLIDENTISIVTPPHSNGYKDINIVNYDGGSVTEQDAFEYVRPESEPEIDGIEPGEGPQNGGTEITVTGQDFREGVELYVGGKPCSELEFVDYKTIKAVTPPGEVGSADVTVINEDIGTFVLENGFEYIYVEPPQIDKVNPDEGPADGGTEITIKGSNFQSGAEVLIGEVQADIVEINNAEIKALTSSGDIGLSDVTVKNSDGGMDTLEKGFEFYRPRTEPDTPGWLAASAHDETTIELTWGDAEFANYFEIYMRESGDDDYLFVEQTASDVHEYFVTGLEPSTRYYFKVRAVNELGISGFTGSDSTRTNSGSRDTEDVGKDTVSTYSGSDSVTVTVPGRSALSDIDYNIDLSGAKSQKTKEKVIQINADTARNVPREITIEFSDTTVSIPSSFWNIPQLNNLDSSEREKATARIVVNDAGQREAERALKHLPHGSQILSRVYFFDFEVKTQSSIEKADLFSSPVKIAYDSDVLQGSSVYLRNSSRDWEEAENTSSIGSEISAQIYEPSTFMLVEQ